MGVGKARKHGVEARGQFFLACRNWVWEFSLNFGGDVVNLLTVLVCYNRIISGPRICSQDDTVL